MKDRLDEVRTADAPAAIVAEARSQLTEALDEQLRQESRSAA
ncbi:hypothetical protein [Streptomyces sp. NPDC016172]